MELKLQMGCTLNMQPIFKKGNMYSSTGRNLKIEATGDFFKGQVKPIIRIKGNWLERAGFSPGHRVQVNCIAPGVMELRSTPQLPKAT